MKTTIKELHKMYPDAKFLFWTGDYFWSKTFSENEVLEHPMYNCEFEFDPGPWLERFNEIWIETEILVYKMNF